MNKKKVLFGWKVKASVITTFKQIKEPNGGGRREKQLEPSATYQELLKIATDLFFPDGRSSTHGQLITEISA